MITEYVTAPAILAEEIVSFTLKVAGAVSVIDNGIIASLKVAVINFVIDTLVASFLGLVEVTSGRSVSEIGPVVNVQT